MPRNSIVCGDRSIVIEIEVVCQCDTMTRYDWCDLMFYIAKECDVAD